MRTKNASVGMRLVDDDVFQVGEEVAPVGMMREDARVKHVGVGEHNAGIFTDGRTLRLGSVAVVD